MDTNSRENKRGTSEPEDKRRGKGGQNWPRGDSKGGYGSGWSSQGQGNSSWGNRPKQGGRPDGDKSKEKDAEQEEDWFNENWGPHSMSDLPTEGAMHHDGSVCCSGTATNSRSTDARPGTCSSFKPRVC